MSSARGYNSADESLVDESSWRRRLSRRRILIISISSIFLVAIIVGAVAGTSASKGNGGSGDQSPPSQTPATTIKALCALTTYPGQCSSSLKNAAATDVANPRQFFQLTLQVAMNELHRVASLPAKLANQTEDRLLQKALANCHYLLEDSIYEVNSTILAIHKASVENMLNESHVDDLKTWLSAALTNFDTCLDGLENTTGSFNETMHLALTNSTQFTSNSLAVVAKVLELLSKNHLPTGGVQRRLLTSSDLIELSLDGFPTWLSAEDRRLLSSSHEKKHDEKSSKSKSSKKKKTMKSKKSKKPKKPTKPKKSSNTKSSKESSKSKKPTKPQKPKEPTKPQKPKEPTKPQKPKEPTKPQKPKEPTKPIAPPTPTSPSIKADIVVAKDGSGDVDTVNAAVEKAASISSGSRLVIYVKRGVYTENVFIDKKLPNIMLVGDGMDLTTISGSLNVVDGTPTYSTGTLTVEGKGFIAKDIGFRNTAGPAKHQAVAVRSSADFSVFYRCKFDAYQDTLYAQSQRQFYKDCTIIGTVDFIFGNAAVVFQGCKILPREPMEGQQDTITAQGKSDPNQNTGISIHQCQILPASGSIKAQVYLGRPWKDYSTTVVMKTTIGSLLNPAGWLPWTGNSAPDTIFYAEYENSGAGAGTSGRVTWEGYHPSISDSLASEYTVDKFLQGSSWIPSTGVPFTAGL